MRLYAGPIEWRIKVPNPWARLVRYIRRFVLVRKWNRDVDGSDRFGLKAEEGGFLPSDRFFKWNQLVWQEIAMWVQIGKPVRTAEVVMISRRRGFDDEQRAYLIEMLKLLWLWDDRPMSAWPAEEEP